MMKYPNIAEIRKKNNLSQQDIADVINEPKRTYAAWERGENSIPIEVLVKLADYYGVTIDYLLGRDPLQIKRLDKMPAAPPDGYGRVEIELPEHVTEEEQEDALRSLIRQIVREEIHK